MDKNNKYYSKMKGMIEYVMTAFEDGKVTVTEVWAFGLVLGDTVTTIINEATKWDDTDTAQVKEAAVELYNEFVEPLDLPGPDYVVDPLLRDVVVPGLVEGAVRLAKGKELLVQKSSLKPVSKFSK